MKNKEHNVAIHNTMKSLSFQRIPRKYYIWNWETDTMGTSDVSLWKKLPISKWCSLEDRRSKNKCKLYHHWLKLTSLYWSAHYRKMAHEELSSIGKISGTISYLRWCTGVLKRNMDWKSLRSINLYIRKFGSTYS